MIKDTAPPHRFGPGYDQPDTTLGRSVLGGRYGDNRSMVDIARGIVKGGAAKNAPIRTQRATVHDDSVVRRLLDTHRAGNDVKHIPTDHRPLIDKVHEATFTNPVGMGWFNDLYAVRTLIRKAHCFYLDDATSAMIADFSVAIAHDLESVRRLAIPPFPVTWIDLNNVARLDRIKELGGKLTPTAAGDVAGPPVDRTGWLIHEAKDLGGFYMTYFCEVGEGILSAPLSYWWQCGSSNPRPAPQDETTRFLQGLSFGLGETNVNPYDAYVSPTPLNNKYADIARDQVRDMMVELAGEMRHVWGLLLALNATSQFGVEMTQEPRPKHDDIRTMPNNKPLLPLEHKVLHLHLRKRWTAEKTTLRTITHHKHRWHEVRGHMRTLRNADGSVRAIIPIPAHTRGDERLGKIIKTYKVEK